METVKNQWEQLKIEIDNNFRQYLTYLEQNDPFTAKAAEQYKNKLVQNIESDLYPERKKNKGDSGWIWFLVIGGIMVLGLIGFLLRKKRKKKL